VFVDLHCSAIKCQRLCLIVTICAGVALYVAARTELIPNYITIGG
jgi:hypothetical protein